MKIFFVVLLAFLYAAQGVPSKGVTHDTPAYSMKNDLSGDTFIEEIPDDSFGTYGEYGADPKIEAVGYDHEHTYEDFSADIRRYPEHEQFRSFEGFEDVIPRDVRVSGLSFEDEQYYDYAGTKHSDSTENKEGTSADTRHTERDSENQSASAGLGEDFDMPENEVEDLTVKGLSDYSYLVGDKLHGINELRAAGDMNRAHKVSFDVEDGEEFEDFGYDVEKDEDLNYDTFLEEEDREVQDYEYDHEYDDADEVTIRGQAVGDEDDEELDEDDFEESEELGDSGSFEDDDDEGDEDEYDDIDSGVRTTDMGDDGEYDEDEDGLEDDDHEYEEDLDEEEIQLDAKLKGMSVDVLNDDEYDVDDEYDEEFDSEDDDEYEVDLPGTGRQDEEEEGDEEEGEEYDDDYVRELDEDDEDWDEEDDDYDSTSRNLELDEDIPEVDENEASESVHGDEIRSDIKAETRK